jgi:hypothetical protein
MASLANRHMASLANRHMASLTNRHTASLTNRHTASLTHRHTASLTNWHTASLNCLTKVQFLSPVGTRFCSLFRSRKAHFVKLALALQEISAANNFVKWYFWYYSTGTGSTGSCFFSVPDPVDFFAQAPAPLCKKVYLSFTFSTAAL